MSDDAGPVAVATAPDSVAGSMLAAALESAGIPAEVRGTRGGWLFPGAQGGFGPVEICVPARLVADAQAILAALDAPADAADSASA
jgi:hypothetical protein